MIWGVEQNENSLIREGMGNTRASARSVKTAITITYRLGISELLCMTVVILM